MKWMNFLKKFFKSIPKPVLGRWTIVYNPKVIDIKVDQANEDHCGCCGKK